jgi:hypothetical protein
LASAGVAGFPRNVYDAKAAVRYLRSHAAEHQLDAELKMSKVPHELQMIPHAGHNPVSLETMTTVADWLRKTLGH